MYLQKSASIQPRTRLSKFGGDSIHFSTNSLGETVWLVRTDEGHLGLHHLRLHFRRSARGAVPPPLRHLLRELCGPGRGERPQAARSCELTFWRRGMGQFPRKCKLRGPSGVTVGSAYINCGSAYISPGPNCENPAKIRQTLAKI